MKLKYWLFLKLFASLNAISWVNSFKGPWKMQFYFNEICLLASWSWVSFQHISGSANSMKDCLANQGVTLSCNLSAPMMLVWLVSGIVLLYPNANMLELISSTLDFLYHVNIIYSY